MLNSSFAGKYVERNVESSVIHCIVFKYSTEIYNLYKYINI